MKKVLLAILFLTGSSLLFAQKKTTTSAIVAFDATTPKDEYPKAENKTVIAAIDVKAKTVAFEANVKNFAFTNARIQQHFSGENWMNADKFPAFTYKGKLSDAKLDLSKDGTYKTDIDGDLTIKDITKKLKVPATIVVKNGIITGTSTFTFKLSDFNISGKSIEDGKVAAEPKITVSAEFK